MRRAKARPSRAHHRATKTLPRSIAPILLAVLWSFDAQAQLVLHGAASDRITDALTQIRLSSDPCGESGQVDEMLARLEGCTSVRYEIRTSTDTGRNVFDRPIEAGAAALPRTITWNPELRTEIEPGCDGDLEEPVRRDPTASLLHELVHAAQDCAGRNPGEHEFEAVRIENIYRRAAGLCQRRGYGNDPLPPQMVRICRAGKCPCSVPPEAGGDLVQNLEGPSSVHAGSTGIATGRADQARQRNGDRPE